MRIQKEMRDNFCIPRCSRKYWWLDNLTSELSKCRWAFWKDPRSGNKTFEAVFLFILFLLFHLDSHPTRGRGAVKMAHNDGNYFWSPCASPRYGDDMCLLDPLTYALSIILFPFLFCLHLLGILSAFRFINFFEFYNAMPDMNQYPSLLGLDNSAKSFHSL